MCRNHDFCLCVMMPRTRIVLLERVGLNTCHRAIDHAVVRLEEQFHCQYDQRELRQVMMGLETYCRALDYPNHTARQCRQLNQYPVL